MSNKERRHQEEEREHYTDEQKLRIQRKSDDRCVWCGKKVFLGYEGTVDHFIPLKKGGTNDEVNLVLMCYDCNQKKGSRIYPINIAGSYLNDGPRRELGKYFDDYVEKYDYISRGNLMSSDAYEMFFLPPAVHAAQYKARKKGKDIASFQRSKYILKRAYPEDVEKIVTYFAKYLKKYNSLHSVEAARVNIQFWMRFGSIYYIEKSNEICSMTCVTVNNHGYISFDVFTYYSTVLALTMAKGMVRCLGDAIMEENDLSYLPISFNILENDELANHRIPGHEYTVHLPNERMLYNIAFIYNPDYLDKYKNRDELLEDAVPKFKDFISRFYDIEDDIMMYLYQNNLMDYTWMADEILGRDYFDESYYMQLNEK